MTKEVETLRKDGFTGFVPVAELRGNSSILPDESGVYIVVRDQHWRLLKSVNAKLLNSVFMLVTRFSGLQTLSHFSNDYIGVGALKLGSPIFHECRTIHFQPDC